MPFLDTVPGIEASIWVGNEELAEYEDDEEEQSRGASKTTSRFIESKSDCEYEVQIIVDQSYNFTSECLIFDVSIDGKYMTGAVMTEQLHPRIKNRLIKPGTVKVTGIKEAIPGKPGQAFLKKFKFSKIETTTNEAKIKDVKKDSQRISDVGDIKIEVFRGGAATPTTPAISNLHRGSQKAENVHEKALKGQAKSHTTLLGPSSEITRHDTVSTARLGSIAIFKFKYRSRDALKSLLIIKRSESPESEPELVSAGPFATGRKVKPERILEDISGLNRPVKRERVANENGKNSRKKQKSEEIMMIDLTASDGE